MLAEASAAFVPRSREASPCHLCATGAALNHFLFCLGVNTLFPHYLFGKLHFFNASSVLSAPGNVETDCKFLSYSESSSSRPGERLVPRCGVGEAGEGSVAGAPVSQRGHPRRWSFPHLSLTDSVFSDIHSCLGGENGLIFFT